MSISDCVRLITHKWAMTDVKVTRLEDRDLRTLLEILQNAGADSWVTSQLKCNPFVNVAGTLRRSLQSEQPSLKVAWFRLVLRDAEPAPVLQNRILSAYSSLLKGRTKFDKR